MNDKSFKTGCFEFWFRQSINGLVYLKSPYNKTISSKLLISVSYTWKQEHISINRTQEWLFVSRYDYQSPFYYIYFLIHVVMLPWQSPNLCGFLSAWVVPVTLLMWGPWNVPVTVLIWGWVVPVTILMWLGLCQSLYLCGLLLAWIVSVTVLILGYISLGCTSQLCGLLSA